MRLAATLAAILLVAVTLPAQYNRGFWINPAGGELLPPSAPYPNDAGEGGIVHTDGAIDTTGHPFFTPLGSNGRACVTCHQPAWGMSVSAQSLRDRWFSAGTSDPVFAAIDGSNCPGLPQHLEASHSLAIERGLFRIPIAWPPADAEFPPEFTIELVRDPTGCNISPRYGLGSANPAISVFRRPRPVANLRYVTEGPGNLMADGREPSLASQARGAVLGHQQGSAPSQEALDRIVRYESQVYAAQMADGLGPALLSRGVKPDYTAIQRGADVFLHREFSMVGVAHSPSIKLEAKGTCASCHSTPLTGQAPSAGWADVGTTNQEIEGLPLFKITCARDAAPHPLGREIYTTDPGRALISGKCADVGAIVMQQLRGLAARPPYFVNGSARTLLDVVDYYDQRFEMKLSDAEKVDLVRFLEAL